MKRRSVLLLLVAICVIWVGAQIVSAQDPPPCPPKADCGWDTGDTGGGSSPNEQPSDSFNGPAASSPLWHTFFCIRQEACGVGDFNGDGRDDIIAFARSTKTGDGEGDVYVALSEGSLFGQGWPWHPFFCIGEEICLVGDFDGDGKDDIAAFARSWKTGDGAGDVYVSLSTGWSFRDASVWHGSFCYGEEVCQVGDFNGDGKDDIAAFVRSSKSGDGAGDVWVALSSGGAFANPAIWHDSFCYGDEVCKVGDFNDDGFADIAAFVRSSKSGDGEGDVWVARSDGTRFGPAAVWQGTFCYGQEICEVGDFNGDGRTDIVAFVRSSKSGDGEGDVWVAFADPTGFGQGQGWHRTFCYGQEICAVGDFNGDGRDDIVAFVRSAKQSPGEGDVWVGITGQ